MEHLQKQLQQQEELLKNLATFVKVIAEARRQENPAYPFHPAMRLNDGMKLVKTIVEQADALGVEPVQETVVEEPVPEPEITLEEVPVPPDETDTTPPPDDTSTE